MRPDIYKVKDIGSGYLGIMAKPVSGEYIEDEFFGIAREEVKQIVSLLEPAEEYSVGLRREQELAEAKEWCFVLIQFQIVVYLSQSSLLVLQ